MMKRRIFLVRHGETDWNLAGRLQGSQDIPLNDLGREQAAQSARVVERLAGDIGPLAYVASPLGRASQTMAILRAELGLAPNEFRRDDRLKELMFGRWEGATWHDLRRRDPVSMMARDADPWNHQPPAGESYAMLMTRVMAAIGDITQDSVVVSHGGVVKVLLHALAGMPQVQATELPVRQGAVYLLRDGAFELAVA